MFNGPFLFQHRYIVYSAAVCLCLLFLVPASDAIVRRDDVDDQEYIDFGANFPAVGHFSFNGSIRGSGSLIAQPGSSSSEWVLTAAHLSTPNEFTVGGATYGVSEFIRHSGWDEDSGGPPATGVENDIALARLASPVTDITPLRWHTNDDDIAAGVDIVSVGVGLAGTGLTGEQSGTSGTRRAAENTVSSVGTASPVTPPRTAFEYRFHAPGETLVKVLEGMGVLFDSGGAVLADFDDGDVIIGIHSYVRDNDGQGRGTYGDDLGSTRVTLFDEWIEQTIPEPGSALILLGAMAFFGVFNRHHEFTS